MKNNVLCNIVKISKFFTPTNKKNMLDLKLKYYRITLFFS